MARIGHTPARARFVIVAQRRGRFAGSPLRLRAAWGYGDTPAGTRRGTDYRIDRNWPISLA